MDFYRITQRSTKRGTIEIRPSFIVQRSKDLMVRGGAFYAIFNRNTGLWSTDEYDVATLVDAQLYEYKENMMSMADGQAVVQPLSDFTNRGWSEFQSYCKNITDNAKDLDMTVTFKNTEVKQTDYISKRLPYSKEEGSTEYYDSLIGTLYSPNERAKIEWAIGAVIAGDSIDIQKFIVLYGEAGSGKSTILEIIQMLLQGYYTTFEAKALTSNNNAFATEVFKDNPLVAIQHDGDLSKISDNTKLNSIVSHELMTMNEKYKASYMSRVNAFLFMATNTTVKITDSKSGIIRRLIDVQPSGNKLPVREYQIAMQQVSFELGAIAHHCLEVYRSMGKNYYDEYRPEDMIKKTDIFFNFVMEYFYTFKEQDGAALNQAYDMYKEYMEDSKFQFIASRMDFREELKNYFHEFHERTRETFDGVQTRNYFSGFKTEIFTFEEMEKEEKEHQLSLVLDQTTSIFDEACAERPAQYTTANGTPMQKWEDVDTILADLDTSELHYVTLEEQHIVVDFDLTNDEGDKDLGRNMEAASKWPATYAEISRGGQGIHLHYIYSGDVTQLSRLYDEDIEIKSFPGKSSLRRKLTKCNNIPIATINSGLPLKGEDAIMINRDSVKSEKALRNLVIRNLNKEIHPGTKPSVDFIHKILEDAYESELVYDLTDLRQRILSFAVNSTNQAAASVKLVAEMKFKSEVEGEIEVGNYSSEQLAFFDVEVYQNLFVVVWKFKGGDKVNMINPTAEEIGRLFDLKLIGFNCRRYDNHILYARHLGYDNMQLYELSQKIIGNSKNAMFREAYNISYADIYEFSSKKQSLAKWQIELGIKHDEMQLPWDEPVAESDIPRIVEYCGNDVDSTEALFEARESDWIARQILSDLSGLTENHSNIAHTAKIIFGNDPNPQSSFEYTDLSEMFPGYTYSYGKSEYRGEDPKEGGYVYAEPGIYTDVEVLDIASMHPRSLIEMNAFGKYTKNYEELMDTRLDIKHGRFEEASKKMNGVLAPYLKDRSRIKNLDVALKIVINIVYGLTSAKFNNKFKDPRNVDNIVAKRGALFMIDLKHEVQARGYIVAHIKTDSIKIPNADQEIIDFVIDFGKKYGYDFEHEAGYSKLALVNNSVYVGKSSDTGEWDTVGAEFADPYVYKKLFSGEDILFEDMCETKSVTTALYLDMNEGLPEGEHDRRFIGKVGRFTPMLPGVGAGELLREKDGLFHSASGAKGYLWMESGMVEELGLQDKIDTSYYQVKVDKAFDKLAQFGDAEWFISNEEDI